MEVSALKYRGGLGLHARSPILRLQSDERLIAFVRRGNVAAFEALVGRYETRLLAFCRHLLGSREDAEDILQEVMAAAFNAILADERPIKVRPWLYRIARNRCLNHLRRNQALGVDSMDVHFSDNGASTADKVHDREEFRLLVGDIQDLPETQRTALVLREMDALSYEQIAEAMETTVPSVKSLLVRARVSLAEAAEARLLSCEEVRLELGEVAEGLRRRPSALVRRHIRYCDRCSKFRVQLRETNKALAALLPFGPLVVLKKLAFTHLGHSAGSGAAGSGAGAAGSGAAAGTGTAAGSAVATGAGGAVSAGIGAVATKAVAGLAVTAIVTASAVEVGSSGRHSAVRHNVASAGSGGVGMPLLVPAAPIHHAVVTHKTVTSKPQDIAPTASKPDNTKQSTTPDSKASTQPAKPAAPSGRTVVNNDTTNLATSACGSAGATATTTTPTTTTTTTTPTTTTPTTPAATPSCPPAPATGLDSAGGSGGSTPTGSTTPPTGTTGANPADGTGGTPPAGGGQPPAGGGQGGSPPPDGGSSGTTGAGGGGTPGTTGTGGPGTSGGGGSGSGAPPTGPK